MSTIPSKRWWKKQGDLRTWAGAVGDQAGMPLRFRPAMFVVGHGDVDPLEDVSLMSSRAARNDDIDIVIGAVGGAAGREANAFSIVCVGILGTSVERAFLR